MFCMTQPNCLSLFLKGQLLLKGPAFRRISRFVSHQILPVTTIVDMFSWKIIDAIHSGSLLKANYKKTEIFGFEIPTEVEGIPSEILDPINSWSDKKAHKDTLVKLGGLFKKNFEVFANHKIGVDGKLTEEILAAGPIF